MHDSTRLGKPTFEQITSLTNPGIFSANEIKVGCCIVDILKQLSGEEISRNPSGGSKQRMNRLANHLLSQHRNVFNILLMEFFVLDIKEV
ncbi:hypothetical protein LOK49_LG10G00110 [Camellia lanceoleosa]|uniref:Uncharacterized protein n=1 Tax=Camellia lanceoleosa TaxID=1840588 RepID=A0ACC0GCE7_9ERIC|nr:hypothetical protein LOK49_LG10G00110 [Camellia lanceoleosa]